MTKSQLLNHVYETYQLTTEDVFKHQQGWVIFTRSGIEKIQAAEDIRVAYSVIKMKPDFAVVKAIATKGSNPETVHYFGDDKETYERQNAIPVVETFGSAKKGGFKDGTTQSWYIAEMAEKRALSRAVLKITGLYQHGAFGEDEADDFKDDRKDLTAAAINAGNNSILKGENTADEVIEKAESAGYIVGETQKYNWRKLKPQS